MKNLAQIPLRYCILAALATMLASERTQAAIIRTGGSGQAYTIHYSTGNSLSSLTPIDGSTVSSSVSGKFSATAAPSFLINESGTGATFSSGNIGLAANGFGYASVYSVVSFSLDQATTYTISGNLSGLVTGGSAQPYANAYIQDGAGILFSEKEFINNPAPVGPYSIVIGDGGIGIGNSGSVFNSASGILQPGHHYMVFEAYVNGYPSGQLDGSGNFTFTLGSGATPVPEPSTYIAGALLLLSFGRHFVRRFKHNPRSA